MDSEKQWLGDAITAVRTSNKAVRTNLKKKFRTVSSNPSASEDHRFRANLALISEDESRLEPIGGWLLQASPDDLTFALPLLRDHRPGLAYLAWKNLENPNTDDERRLRAAAVGAFAAPTDPRWTNVRSELAEWLIRRNVYTLPRWLVLFEPLSASLVDPLRKIYADETVPYRVAAASAVAIGGLLRDPGELVSLARKARPSQLGIIASALSRNVNASERILHEEINEGANIADEALIREVSRLALTLLLFHRGHAVWPLLRFSNSPDLRTEIVHGMAKYGVDPDLLIKRLSLEDDPGTKSGILLALGDYDTGDLPLKKRDALVPALSRYFVESKNSGVRSAAEWLLRSWDYDLPVSDRQNRSGHPRTEKDWYLTRDGDFTMVVLDGPITFNMGSPDSEEGRGKDEARQRITIDHSYAIATKEVTAAQFMEFAKAMDVNWKKNTKTPEDPWNAQNVPGLNPDDPLGSAMTSVTLKEAMLFCWWFSKREGISADEQCYIFPAKGRFDDADPRTHPDFLNRTGYRLPTEAEWEYGCRGGCETACFYGSSNDYLPMYAWWKTAKKNRYHVMPPGQLRPNPFGLFDILGNGSEWCQERYRTTYRLPSGDIRIVGDQPRTRDEPSEENWPVFRGGSVFDRQERLRSAQRQATRYPNLPFTSFRIVRTIKPTLN